MITHDPRRVPRRFNWTAFVAGLTSWLILAGIIVAGWTYLPLLFPAADRMLVGTTLGALAAYVQIGWYEGWKRS